MELNYFEEDSELFHSLEGKILVASKNLDGTCFEKALIYICAHDLKKGALGIIINNKIGNFSIEDHIPNNQLNSNIKNKKVPIMFGGPVEQERLLILSISPEQEKNFNKLQSVTIYTESKSFLKKWVSGKMQDKFIVLKGFAAWEPFQLEKEIEVNSWLICHASLDILFSQKIKNKWDKIVKNIGITDFTNLVNYTGNA